MSKETVSVKALATWAIQHVHMQSRLLYPRPEQILEAGAFEFFDWLREQTGMTESEVNTLLDEIEGTEKREDEK